MSAPEFFTPAQVVERYAGVISVRTLANWRSAGAGPDFVKVGGRVVYERTAVERWEAARKRRVSGE